MTDTTAASPLSGNVLFYAQPEPLSVETHGALGVDAVDKPYAFVAQTNLVPVMVTAQNQWNFVTRDLPIAIMMVPGETSTGLRSQD